MIYRKLLLKISDIISVVSVFRRNTLENQLYISTKKAAEMLDVTDRRIVGLCQNGDLEGAFKEGRTWKIPKASVIKFAEETNRSLQNPEQKELLPCAIGNTSYVELVSECYYVDKTLLIRDLIDDHNSVTLFTRPRRFGKTLNMNMLKTYFEKTENDTSIYFQEKKIWKCGEKYKAQQGSFPVIMLTFKDIKYNSWPDSMDDSCAREEWDWKPTFTLDEMTVDMIENLRKRLL